MSGAAASSAKGQARGRECKRSVTLLLEKPRRYHPSPPRPEASGFRYPNPWVAGFSLQRLEALPAEGLLTMFLVSWSLFSRLSRMKDSVSSSCRERGGHHQKPETTASRLHSLARTRLPGTRPPPTPATSRSRRPARISAPFLTSSPASPAPPASACPRSPAAGRTPPAGGS